MVSVTHPTNSTAASSPPQNLTDILIIGGGIIGLAVANQIKERRPELDVTIIEKESSIAEHASGRNSGVLHAGFYYTSDSLKARFTIAGNNALRAFCKRKNLPVNECGKLVVARNAAEVESLKELERRGNANGSGIHLIDESEAERIEPNVKTFEKAIWSPRTATVDPRAVCAALADELRERGVKIELDTAFSRRNDDGSIVVTTSANERTIHAKKIVNCAGLYADKIAWQFGFGKRYTIIPFKGLYIKYTKNKTDIRTNIYPVPNLKNPFLGVHFTKTVHDDIKIGPTAIPSFWRENYKALDNFKLNELVQILFWEGILFTTNAFGFRSLAFEEIKKYRMSYMAGQAAEMVKQIDPAGFTEYTKPGIRAQLLERSSRKLLTDFMVEHDSRSVHVLNAVSPAFTCSLPFADYVVEKYVLPL